MHPYLHQQSWLNSQDTNIMEWHRCEMEELELLNKAQMYPTRILKSNRLKDRHVCLVVNKLYIVNENKVKWADIENAIIFSGYTEERGYSITLVKTTKTIQLYGSLIQLYNDLKLMCIQQHFQLNYKVLEKIGSGNYADVFRSQSKSNDQMYAIKCINKSTNTMSINQLCTEIGIMRRLSHQSIVQYYEAFENDDFIFLVLELLEGQDLVQLTHIHKQLSKANIKQIMKQLLEAAVYMHSQGIIHRDLKPQNIKLRKLDQFDQLCIFDYGLSVNYCELGNYELTRCGTPGHVAPEVLQDQPYDYKADVYSIGLLMYQLLCGNSPFKSRTYDQMINKNYAGKIDFTRIQINSVAMSLLVDMLKLDPEFRLSSQEALSHSWFKKITPQLPQFIVKTYKTGNAQNSEQQKQYSSYETLKERLNHLSPLSFRQRGIDVNQRSSSLHKPRQGVIIYRKSVFRKS